MRSLLVVTALLLNLPACHSTDRITLDQSGAATRCDPAPALAGIPFPTDAPARNSSAVPDRLWAAGREAYLDGGDAMAVGNDMLLSAGPGNLSYSIYELYGGSPPIEAIHFAVNEVIAPEHVWIGIADYAARIWRWRQYDAAEAQYMVLGRNVVSPGGGTYLAIAAWDNAFATVEEVWIASQSPDWVVYPIQPAGLNAQQCSMARIGGYAGILLQALGGGGNYSLYYFYTTFDIPSSGGWTPSIVAFDYPDPLQYLQLIEDEDQRPAFAVTYPSYQLWYANSTVDHPVSAVSWAYSYVAEVSYAGFSLALVDDNPALAYLQAQPGGGEKIMYARANHPQPVGPDWTYFTAAQSANPLQDYGAPGLCGGTTPVIAYWDVIQHAFYYWSSPVAMPGGDEVKLAVIDNPPLGGADPHLVNWQGGPALIYDSVNGVLPRYVRPTAALPESPADFTGRHRISHMSAWGPVVAAHGAQLGIAFRDPRDESIKFAWCDTGDPHYDGALDSGADWRVVTVESRPTSGQISLTYVSFGIPALCYYVTGDNFYFARMVPTSG